MSAARRSTIRFPLTLRVSLEANDRILVRLDDSPQDLPNPDAFCISPATTVTKVLRSGPRALALIGGPFDEREKYVLTAPDGSEWPVLPDGILDRYRPSGPMGIFRDGNEHQLRFFAPRLRGLQAEFRHNPDDDPFAEIALTLNVTTGCWEGSTDVLHDGDLVAYRTTGAPGGADVDNLRFADPWSWAVVKRDDWNRRSMTLILPDELLRLPDADHVDVEGRQRVIYEAHLQDVTRLHPAVPGDLRGTYLGAVHQDSDRETFHDHLKMMGINTVEWLPLADYDHWEPPYGKRLPGNHNTWNIYSRNHWGYMPAYWFAPESRYAGPYLEGGWIGRSGAQVRQLREMIRRQHELGFSVIVDVVYNHVAQYGENPIRQIDPLYALRHDGKGNRISESGCGNDLATERPVIRRLVLESLLHWTRYYGVDGFRFDLAGVLDDILLDEISQSLREEMPDICLIAEPWGRRYDKTRYTQRNWASWNDHFRDGIRGSDPQTDNGVLMGNKVGDLLRHLSGNLMASGGPYPREEFSVNYLASHDGYTLADFLRMALQKAEKYAAKMDYGHTPLSHTLLSRLKLAFFILLTSRGMIMWHQGDEFGHSKRIVHDAVQDPSAGKLDHDSYNKDNATNWLDWSLLDEPSRLDLVRYIAGLSNLRQKHPALTLARWENLTTITANHRDALGVNIFTGTDQLLLLFNLSNSREAVFKLPEGRWIAWADHQSANADAPVSGVFAKNAVVAEMSGLMLAPTTHEYDRA
ncbi:MAG: alpha-amylase family glycosyl hydrolase [bacterium]